MKITRRSFIRTSGTAVLAAGVLGSFGSVFGQSRAAGDDFAVPAGSQSDPVFYLTRAHFEPHLNSLMRVSDGEKVSELRLVELPDYTLAANQKKGYYGESFSLILAGSARERLAPGVYTFEHPALGTFALSINPVGRTNRYEAVINRIGR